jgi:hypothetical protein
MVSNSLRVSSVDELRTELDLLFPDEGECGAAPEAGPVQDTFHVSPGLSCPRTHAPLRLASKALLASLPWSTVCPSSPRFLLSMWFRARCEQVPDSGAAAEFVWLKSMCQLLLYAQVSNPRPYIVL